MPFWCNGCLRDRIAIKSVINASSCTKSFINHYSKNTADIWVSADFCGVAIRRENLCWWRQGDLFLLHHGSTDQGLFLVALPAAILIVDQGRKFTLKGKPMFWHSQRGVPKGLCSQNFIEKWQQWRTGPHFVWMGPYQRVLLHPPCCLSNSITLEILPILLLLYLISLWK